MKTYIVTGSIVALAPERVEAHYLQFKESGHVAFYEHVRGQDDRLVIAVYAPATVVEERASS